MQSTEPCRGGVFPKAARLPQIGRVLIRHSFRGPRDGLGSKQLSRRLPPASAELNLPATQNADTCCVREDRVHATCSTGIGTPHVNRMCAGVPSQAAPWPPWPPGTLQLHMASKLAPKCTKCTKCTAAQPARISRVSSHWHAPLHAL